MHLGEILDIFQIKLRFLFSKLFVYDPSYCALICFLVWSRIIQLWEKRTSALNFASLQISNYKNSTLVHCTVSFFIIQLEWTLCQIILYIELYTAQPFVWPSGSAYHVGLGKSTARVACSALLGPYSESAGRPGPGAARLSSWWWSWLSCYHHHHQQLLLLQKPRRLRRRPGRSRGGGGGARAQALSGWSAGATARFPLEVTILEFSSFSTLYRFRRFNSSNEPGSLSSSS